MLHASHITPASDMPNVRIAERRDEEDLVSMVREMHQDPEWGLGLRDADGKPFSWDPIKAREKIQRATQVNRNAPDRDQAWIGVVGDNGALWGSAYVCVQEASLGTGIYLCEVWNWTRPEYRARDITDALLAFSIGVAQTMRLSLYSATVSERMAKSRHYERHMGRPLGAIYGYHKPVGPVGRQHDRGGM